MPLTAMWERTVNEFTFGARLIMDTRAFDALPVIEAKPEAVADFQHHKALIERGGRTCWHTVSRGICAGMPCIIAQEIVIRRYIREDD